MLMFLSVHVTSVLFLVRFNNFALTMGVTCSYSSRPLLCALALFKVIGKLQRERLRQSCAMAFSWNEQTHG